MTVGELIDLLEQQPRDKEVLIDCRGTDYVEVYLQECWYPDGEPVVHIDV